MLDIGTVDSIRQGKIKVLGGVERIDGTQVEFADGTTAPFDIIIEATGYRPDLRSLLPDHLDALDQSFGPKTCRKLTAYPGLFFCGHIPVATGQLREIGIEARRIASLIQMRRISRLANAAIDAHIPVSRRLQARNVHRDTMRGSP